MATQVWLCTVCVADPAFDHVAYIQMRLLGVPRPDVGYNCCEHCTHAINPKVMVSG
jgi:hypothetical protein